MGDQKLQGMTTGEVAEKALEAGLENVEQMNKQEMIDALGEAQPQSSEPGHGGGQGDEPKPSGTDSKDWKDVPGNQS
jgi:hypothetical protein